MRNISPAENLLSFLRDQTLEGLALPGLLGLVAREEHHADRVCAGLGQFDAELAGLLPHELVGQLDQDSSAVTGLGIAPAGAAVLEPDEHLDARADQLVRLLALDVRDEPDPTGVPLIGGIVEAVSCRRLLGSFLHASLASRGSSAVSGLASIAGPAVHVDRVLTCNPRGLG